MTDASQLLFDVVQAFFDLSVLLLILYVGWRLTRDDKK